MERLSLERITIYDPGFVLPRALGVSDLACSWAISEVGRLSCTASSTDVLTAKASAPSILGRWVIYEHPTGGTWSGYVEDAQVDLETGTTDLSCVQIVNLLAYRRTGISFTPQQMSAGSLVMRAIEDSASDDQLWLADVQIDDSDVLLSYEQNGDSIMSLMDRLVGETGEEWLATSDDAGRQSLQWRQRVGSEDIVAQFSEGRGILGGFVEQSIATMVNDILAVADDDSYALSTREVVTDRAGILAYGRRQQTRRYLNITAGASLASAASRDLRMATMPTQLITLSVAHLDERLENVREGNRVMVTLPSVDAQFRTRVVGRTYEVLPGVATLLLEVEQQLDAESIYVEGAGVTTSAE